jgi:type II secretory pathway component PulC
MAQKVSKKYSLNIQGVVSVDEDGKAYVSVEDRGEFEIYELLRDFDGKECKISVNYDEDYIPIEVDPETGEVI